nr:MAG TPA: hypothetical protein [Caudoviricetes sp.]
MKPKERYDHPRRTRLHPNRRHWRHARRLQGARRDGVSGYHFQAVPGTGTCPE